MSNEPMTWQVTDAELRDGDWCVGLEGPGRPRIEVRLGEAQVAARLAPGAGAGQWTVRCELPARSLTLGAQVMVMLVDGHLAAHLPVLCGADAGQDLRAEVALLRAELDLMKRMLRRMGRETAG